MGQRFHHSSKFKKDLSALKGKLNDLAHSFYVSPIDLSNFTKHCECFAAIRSLRNNNDIINTRAGFFNEVNFLVVSLNDVPFCKNFGYKKFHVFYLKGQ